LIRINKYLSICGVTSRRGAEQLIKAGKVTINDKTVESLGVIIDEDKDTVKVDGTEVTPVKKNLYILLNKPKNVLTTLHDPFRRKTVAHYLKSLDTRVYPVGRLDYDTEGVLLLTNDGDLAYRLAHPKYRVKKVYRVFVRGAFSYDDGQRIERGIKLQDGHTGKGRVKILKSGINSSKVRIILTEGHKREIKQLMRAVGHRIINLRRMEFAGLRTERLRPGRWRHLSHREVTRLKELVGLPS
jgi:23S rRNA pseudouridine2605 synthase